MLVLAWLLSVCVVGGSSRYDSREYGQIYRMRLHVRAKSLEFISSRGGESVVLWKEDEPSKEDSRRKVLGYYFVVYNVTQEDSGKYTTRDRNGLQLSSWNLDVEENSESYTRYTGETLSITFKLDPGSCNIYFIPEGIDEDGGTYIVRYGWLDYNMYNLDCPGFEQTQPCGIVSPNLQMSCSGRYLVKDNNGNTALAVQLEMESSSSDTSKIGISAGIVSIVVSCCCCLKRCCCGKSSSKKDEPETPDGEPAVEHHEYDHEPAGSRSYQLSPEAVTLYPAQPSTGPTRPSDPLIHPPPTPPPPPPPPPPTMGPPPAYSEVTAKSATNDAPTVSIPMDLGSEPRFELKGLTFSSAPPLSSNSSCGDVYTSDKLNFL